MNFVSILNVNTKISLHVQMINVNVIIKNINYAKKGV